MGICDWVGECCISNHDACYSRFVVYCMVLYSYLHAAAKDICPRTFAIDTAGRVVAGSYLLPVTCQLWFSFGTHHKHIYMNSSYRRTGTCWFQFRCGLLCIFVRFY